MGTFGKVSEQEALGEFAFKEVEYWAHVQNTYFVEQEAFPQLAITRAWTSFYADSTATKY